MQWLLTVAIWVVFVGGVALYVEARHRPPDVAVRSLVEASGEFEVALTATHDIGAAVDPFALAADASAPAASVRVAGSEVAHAVEELPAGRTVVVGDLEGLVSGRNELFVEVAPPAGAAPYAVRVALRRDGVEVAHLVLWGEPGRPARGVLALRLEQEAGHDH